MNSRLANELLRMAKADIDLRNELAADGTLFHGYNLRMKAVHDANAKRLTAIIRKSGWPGKSQVGEEAAHAAWLILQHAIAHPYLQKKCFPLLVEQCDAGEIPKHEVAMLEDRIRCFEGRPQRFGTQFDWDESGKMSPLPMDDPYLVDARRKQLGMTSLAEETLLKRKEVAASKEKPPADYHTYSTEKEQWLKANGWR